MATTTRTRPSVRPEALEAASSFPALEAIFTRRARRFALGAELTGPLAYRSDKEPVPLAFEEEAILVAAATGVTGVVREEWPFRSEGGEATGADKLASFTGRSFPSPLAIHGTELFWTNDDGVFVLPQRDVKPERYLELQTHEERHELYRSAVKLQEGRLEIPRRRPNLFKFNEWVVNIEGATLFIPVSDVTRQCISAMLLYFDRPHGYYVVDKQLGNDPLRPFVESGLLGSEHPVDLWDFERWQMVDMNGVEEGLMIQNLMSATQALGIGGHPFSGGKGRVTMGGEKHWHGMGGEGPCGSLGFTFHQVPDDAPVGAGEEIPVGLEGIFEGACPPFHQDMDAAVDFVLDLRWGPTGIFSAPEAQQVPWRSSGDRSRGAAPVRGGDRGHQDALPLHLGHVRALPGHDRPVPHDRLVPGRAPRHRLLRPLLPAGCVAGARPLAHARLARPLGQQWPKTTSSRSGISASSSAARSQAPVWRTERTGRSPRPGTTRSCFRTCTPGRRPLWIPGSVQDGRSTPTAGL